MKKYAQKHSSGDVLAATVAYLRYLSSMYQNHHWQAQGDDFYGNHLLFERAYKQTIEDVDKLAEKAIGLNDISIMDLRKQLSLMKAIGQKYPEHISTPDHLRHAIKAEQQFVTLLSTVQRRLENSNELSLGLDNLLAELSDNAESRIYLLKQASLT
jgi:DNA-binding ferritin-like protein